VQSDTTKSFVANSNSHSRVCPSFERNSLTSKDTFVSFKAVIPSYRSRFYSTRRLVSTGVLLFVFFLPFHVHFFNSTPSANNECSCVFGTRTQVSPVSAQAEYAPAIQAARVIIDQPKAFGWTSVHSKRTRGPPHSV
jgi:hypothetical protein